MKVSIQVGLAFDLECLIDIWDRERNVTLTDYAKALETFLKG